MFPGSSPSGSNLSAGDLQALGQERKRALGGQTCAGGTPVDASVSVVLLGQGDGGRSVPGSAGVWFPAQLALLVAQKV